jgi:hypothetical protein
MFTDESPIVSSTESEPPPSTASSGSGESPPASFVETPTAHRDSSSIRVWALALTAGVVAGFASWLVGEALHGRLQPQVLSTGGIPTVEEAREDAKGIKAAVTLEATVAFGSLGAALGLALGLAGGSARRCARSGSIAASFGTILGGIAGVVMPQILLPIYFRFYDPDSDDMILSLLIQGGIGTVVGAVGGASLGIGNRGHIGRALLGGLLGAVAGVLIYEVVGALAFPLDQTTKPISATASTRLFGRLMVATLASAGAVKGDRIARRGDASTASVR